ncbi:hypothetical protein J3458_006978 [Metarhizium acridum]|uniref:uncharacterized protein n=1 Tax=Metarhizium acridum TaxID=92637 RepID=UPI001C6BEF3F|nr:hypothetical protein J3458_006978 [Metarhizium acridum]
MSPEDCREMIEEFNLTEDDAMLGPCLPRLLECTAESHLHKTAFICTGTEMAYGEPNAKANRLTHNLVERGIKCGDLVGVALDRSVDLVVVLVAVLKSGAAYVPIDPAFPAERIGHMVKNAFPKLIVAEPSMIDTMTSKRGVLGH